MCCRHLNLFSILHLEWNLCSQCSLCRLFRFFSLVRRSFLFFSILKEDCLEFLCTHKSNGAFPDSCYCQPKKNVTDFWEFQTSFQNTFSAVGYGQPTVLSKRANEVIRGSQKIKCEWSSAN
jgi:hypothetical protein